MGGFNTSKQIEEIMDEHGTHIPGCVWEILEQAVVMTECFENADTKKFIKWAELFGNTIYVGDWEDAFWEAMRET